MNQEHDGEDEKECINFHQMELDDRIQKSVAQLGWLRPTLIQEKAIPLVLEGKDVLIRARTGSGKTAAFAIPSIQKILNSKQNATEQTTSTLMLAPSKELCHQIKNVICQLIVKCNKIVSVLDLSESMDADAQSYLLSERPDIIVATPAKVLSYLKSGKLNLKKSLSTVVIDEADLVFSFGFKEDLKQVLQHLPNIYQAILASATLSEDVLNLKQLILHNPITLKLEEPELAPVSQLLHYQISAEDDDKAAILYALCKLHLIRGKSIIFVNTVDRCYKLKLFLEQFQIRTCILNSELPAKSRCHAVNQFNQGKYDIIIASDELALEEPSNKSSQVTKKTNHRRKSDKEFGVSRGIDFQCVANVINFDFPLELNSYIHRAGRTARGNNKGTVLSFINLKEKDLMEDVEEYLKVGYSSDEPILKKYQFKLEEVEPFRYRAKDAWRAVTKVAIRDARLREIKVEIFNCEKLKGFFEENPKDLQLLRHDKQLGTVKIQPHLADVPDYIIPDPLKRLAGIGMSKGRKRHHPRSHSKSVYEAKRSNPLMVAKIDYDKKRKP